MPELDQDPVPEAQGMPDAPPPPVEAAAARPPRRAGWLGPVLGGVVAAGMGFGLAQYLPLAPGGGKGADPVEVAALREEVAALSAALAAAGDPSALAARLDSVEARLAEGFAPPDLSALEGRLAVLEARPVGSLSAADAAALAAIQAELATLKAAGVPQAQVEAALAVLDARLARALEEVAALQETQAQAARAATRQGALLQIAAALDSGAPYGGALAALAGESLPEVLTASAETGVPGLKALQDSFPEAARAALSAALREDMGETWSERALNFLRTQVGARALSPQAGDDPDAILSRAEAALAVGDLSTALAELDSLPDPARAAMSTWRAEADRQAATRAALDGLRAQAGL